MTARAVTDPSAPESATASRPPIERVGAGVGLKEETQRAAPAAEDREQASEQAQIKELARIDGEVRAHEAAHAAAGGAIAGAPSYQFTRGPDGRLYATGGEVGIDTSPVPGDPEATIEKARTIIQAAMAPANPSPQDLRVAAQAQALLVEAQAELSQLEAQGESRGGDASTPVAGAPEETARDEEAQPREQEAAERQERLRERRAEFAEQFREMNERLNEVSKRLIEAGVIETLDPEGVFLDLMA